MSKRIIKNGLLILALIASLALSACGDSAGAKVQLTTESEPQSQTNNDDSQVAEIQNQLSSEVENTSSDKKSNEDVELDLTTLSSTMVYSEVYNMMVAPEDYVGKIVKMEGTFAIYESPDTKQIYYACLISDATACCSQGIEFLLDGDYTYPDDYPELGADIVITGEFETYEEEGNLYCRLKNAEMDRMLVNIEKEVSSQRSPC